ncbi:hypothetical protein G6O67_006945 [Ophiocordyceps sinensis]|uniref:U3 snoRNA associated n=1 Tax=Ophiocordyceps sinensis TaxID=72228 RepID=A0A8H4LPM0_9HYPO|nr:hypothetical protein G6O67_008861 [Ophiocordyceps sinensis]KAF4506912.1 hypothetical protein G6O67_006945 [Ophiocordyceps sinensis]
MTVQTRKRKAALEQAASKAQEEASADTSPKRQKLPMRSKGVDALPNQKAAGKSTLITFDDDDNADQPVAAPVRARETAVPSTAEQEPSDDSDDSDDDAAPEAVSTAQVASEMKKSAQASQRAAREQAAAEKRKRQERDVLLKKQAEERKRADHAIAAAALQDGEDDVPPTKQQEATGRRRRTDRVQVPDLLPLEFLTDDSSGEDEADEGEAGDSGARPRRRKIAAVEKRLTRLDRGPQDEWIGTTVYRVAAKLDERLAPKAKRSSLSIKERLLQRNRTAAKPRSGFFTTK